MSPALARFAVVVACLALATSAPAQPITNNCNSASGPCNASTFTASQRTISPSVRTSQIVEKSDGLVQFLNVDGGWAAEIGDYGASGNGSISTSTAYLCSGNPNLCATNNVTIPTLTLMGSSPQNMVSSDSSTSTLHFRSAEYPDGGVIPFDFQSLSTFADSVPFVCLVKNGNGTCKFYVRADGAACFSDATCQTTAATSGVTGSGANTRIAFWTGASSLSSSAALNWDGSKFQAPILDLGNNSGNGQLSFSFPYYQFGNGISIGNGIDPAIVVGSGKVCLSSDCTNYIRYVSSGINLVTAGNGIRSEAMTFTGDSTTQTTAYPGFTRDTFSARIAGADSRREAHWKAKSTGKAVQLTGSVMNAGSGAGTFNLAIQDATTASVLCSTTVACAATGDVTVTCSGPSNGFTSGDDLFLSVGLTLCTGGDLNMQAQVTYP